MKRASGTETCAVDDFASLWFLYSFIFTNPIDKCGGVCMYSGSKAALTYAHSSTLQSFLSKLQWQKETLGASIFIFIFYDSCEDHATPSNSPILPRLQIFKKSLPHPKKQWTYFCKMTDKMIQVHAVCLKCYSMFYGFK